MAAARTESGLVVALVSGSHVVNHMYLVLLPPIVGILAAEFETSVAAIGLAMGAVGVTNTTFQLPYGYLSDTRSRTLTYALALAFGTVGAAIIALSPTYWGLVAGQLVLGVGVAGHHPAHFPLLADATPSEHRGRAFSIHGFAGAVGFATPPAVIAAVVGLPGVTWRHAVGGIAVVGAIYTVVSVVVLATRVDDDVTRPPEREIADASLRERVAAQARAIAGSRAVLALAVLALVVATASWGVTSYAVVLLTDVYGVPLRTASLALTGLFVAGAVMILVGGELADRYAPGPVMVVGYGATAVVVALLAAGVLPALLAVACVVLVGATRTPGAPARSKLADRVSGRDDLGRNFAVITIGIMLGGAVAPPLFGAIIDTAGYRVAFAGVALLALCGAVLSAVVARALARPADADAAPAPGDD